MFLHNGEPIGAEPLDSPGGRVAAMGSISTTACVVYRGTEVGMNDRNGAGSLMPGNLASCSVQGLPLFIGQMGGEAGGTLGRSRCLHQRQVLSVAIKNGLVPPRRQNGHGLFHLILSSCNLFFSACSPPRSWALGGSGNGGKKKKAKEGAHMLYRCQFSPGSERKYTFGPFNSGQTVNDLHGFLLRGQ